MTDLYEALRKAMREQTQAARDFSAAWRASTAWQHKKGSGQ